MLHNLNSQSNNNRLGHEIILQIFYHGIYLFTGIKMLSYDILRVKNL